MLPQFVQSLLYLYFPLMGKTFVIAGGRERGGGNMGYIGKPANPQRFTGEKHKEGSYIKKVTESGGREKDIRTVERW